MIGAQCHYLTRARAMVGRGLGVLLLFLLCTPGVPVLAQSYLVVGSHGELVVEFSEDGRVTGTAVSGWQYPYQQGLFLFGTPHSQLIALPDEPGVEWRVLVSEKTFNPFSVPETQVIEGAELERRNQKTALYQALFMGAFLSLLAYNLLIYFTLREKLFLMYVTFLGVYICGWMVNNGYFYAWLWPNSPQWNLLAPWVFIFIQTIPFLEFATRYLNISRYATAAQPKVRILQLALALTCVVVVAINDTTFSVVATLPLPVLVAAVLFPLARAAWRNGYYPVRHFMAAFACLLVTSFFSIGAEVGLYPASDLSRSASQFGGLAMCIVFAVGMAARINVLKQENEEQRRLVMVSTLEKQFAEAALQEKETMLKEIHHRIKNNLQIVYSLLNLQIDQLSEPAALDAVRSSQGRINTISILHQQLYQSDDLVDVDLAEYLGHVLKHVRKLHHPASADVRVLSQLTPVRIDLKTAVPLGLIVNEVLNNSFRHAFSGPARDKTIYLDMALAVDHLHLEMADNGGGTVALPAHTSLGIALVQDLVQQLRGAFDLNRHAGYRYQIRIPLHHAR